MQGKHEKLAVVLSCDEGAHKDQYKSSSECIETYVLQLMLVTLLVHPPSPYRLPQLSAMGSSYVAPPPGTSAAQPVDPVPKDYHHLESNRALTHPPKGPTQSEVQVRARTYGYVCLYCRLSFMLTHKHMHTHADTCMYARTCTVMHVHQLPIVKVKPTSVPLTGLFWCSSEELRRGCGPEEGCTGGEDLSHQGQQTYPLYPRL